MKVTRLLTALAGVGAWMLATAVPAAAQVGAVAPSSQIGFGIGVDNGLGAMVTGQYAFSPAIQAGVELGFATATSDAQDQTSIIVGPFVRWILEGKVNPIIQAGYRSFSFSTTLKSGTQEVKTTSSSGTIYAGFGFEWFYNRNVGIFSLAEVLHLNSSPSETLIGILNGRVGVEIFLGP